MSAHISNKVDSSLSWDDIKWLVSFTKLPVIAKGILRGDEAENAIAAGCKGIIVSNHGGRLVDSAPATVCLMIPQSPIIPKLIELERTTENFRSKFCRKL